MKTLGVKFSVVYLSQVVKKDIPSIPSPYKNTIRKAIEEKLTSDPLGYSRPLKGNLKGLYRLRVGDYRIAFLLDEEAQTVTITAIKHRGKIYQDLS